MIRHMRIQQKQTWQIVAAVVDHRLCTKGSENEKIPRYDKKNYNIFHCSMVDKQGDEEVEVIFIQRFIIF